MTVRMAVIGCVEFSATMFDTLLDIPQVSVVSVVTKDSSKLNSDFVSLRGKAEEKKIPCLSVSGRGELEIQDFLKSYDVEIAMCAGWSYLLPGCVISSVPRGVIGFHPAELPFNRGRHPLIWALALGLAETASTFFDMNESADEGKIISQKKVQIAPHDDARTLYDKVTNAANSQVREFLPSYLAGNLRPKQQDLGAGNVWRKRTALDGRIDWRMSYEAISNLVRALAPPYPKATFCFDGKDICVGRVLPGTNPGKHIEPGKVLAVEEGKVLVKCWGGAVWLVDHDLTKLPSLGEYLQ